MTRRRSSVLLRSILVAGVTFGSLGCATHSRVGVGVGLSFGEPPLLRREVIVESPGRGFAWVPGYWAGRPRSGYEWVPGRWVRPPRPRAVWIAPRWERRDRGWFFVEGRWHS